MSSDYGALNVAIMRLFDFMHHKAPSEGIPQVLSVFGGMLLEGKLDEAVKLSSDRSIIWSVQH